MQDRFKFRSYYQYQDQTYKMIYDIQKMENFKEWIAQENIDPVMQCTGLKDNTGKLIYEGDIVKFSSIYGHGVFEIKWSDELATFGYEDKDTDFCELGRLYQEAAYVEILGNIYEAPELLKEAQ